MSEHDLTIGQLARAADVGVETIRYYQRRQLLPIPDPQKGAFRSYSPVLVKRICFIKRAQELGFTLEEISTLLQLEEEGSDRIAIRDVAAERLREIQKKISDLQRMEHVLSHLIHECQATDTVQYCPIIEAFGGRDDEA